jgi:hypothetical protein
MNDSEKNSPSQEAKLEVMPPSATEALAAAEISQQIATARQFPRSLEAFKKRALSMACLDEETAESCLYRRPVGKDESTGQQKFAEGMSIRMAEIVGASYGNLRVQSVLIEQTDRFVRARGMAIDLESNFASSSEVVESTVNKYGTPYSERMRIVIAKVALAKARRDVTFQVVPRALAKPIESEVRRILVGDSKTLDKRRALAIGWISKLGIDVKRVYAALGVAGESELDAEKLETLTGLKTAIKDGDVTIDEAFPSGAPEGPKSMAEALGGTKAMDAQKTDLPPPTAEETAKADAARVVLRKAIMDDLQNRILDNKTTEVKLTKAAKAAGLMPEGVDEVWSISTESLAKLAELK